MFDETPGSHDVLYDAVGKDDPAEAAAVLAHVRGKNPRSATLLDVACGTGRRLEVFSKELSCVGTDGDVTYRQERHELGLFAWELYVDGSDRCGLRVTVDDDGLIGGGRICGVRDEDRPHASDPATGATDGS